MTEHTSPDLPVPGPSSVEYDAAEATWEYTARDETCLPIRYKDGADRAFLGEWLGAVVSDEDLHSIAGVPLGARLTISAGRPGYMAISAVGQRRVLNRDGVEVVVRYSSLVHIPLSAKVGGMAAQVLRFHYCTSEPGRTGFATDALGRMAPACVKLGLNLIEGLLAGDGRDATDPSTGYYVWPSQGFDALLSDWEDADSRPLPEDLRETPEGEPVETLQDLFDVPGGAEWWRLNGSSIFGVFEVAEGSQSRIRLQEAADKLARQRRGT